MKRKVLFRFLLNGLIILFFIVIISVFYLYSNIRENIARNSAINYLNNYEKSFEIKGVEYSKYHNAYLVYFYFEPNEVKSLILKPKILPIRVINPYLE